MAKKVTVTLVDDIDGEAPADESIEFAIDGTTYKIDLSSKNAEKLRDQFSVWVEHARKVSGRRHGRASLGSNRKPASIDREVGQQERTRHLLAGAHPRRSHRCVQRSELAQGIPLPNPRASHTRSIAFGQRGTCRRATHPSLHER